MMKAPIRHPLIEDYLRRLDSALADVPRARQADIRAEIVEHIDAAMEDASAPTEVDVRNLLDRLGAPEEIAAEARADSPSPFRKIGLIEVGALVLLPIGAFVVPVVGWIAGVVLLWLSDKWTRNAS